MAWMRAVAGANLITSFRVIYQLVGLTTTGASIATAYAPFSFVLAGSGNRVPPATINVYSDGLLLTVGVDYSYNSATGSVTIYRVAGDIVVEATGKIATIIYTPAAGYLYFAIVGKYHGKYYIVWYSAGANTWRPVQFFGSGGIVPGGSMGEATGYEQLRTPTDNRLYYAAFDTVDAAINALYLRTTVYQTAASSYTIYRASTQGWNPTVYNFSSTTDAYITNNVIPIEDFRDGYASYNNTTQRTTYNATYYASAATPEHYTDYDVIQVQ